MKLLHLLLTLTLLALSWQPVFAHGGVVEEEDLCVITISYLKAHFKIYQPLIDGHKEYCEDLPNATESIFVMEYLHDEMGSVPVDFRIIHDVTGKGRFARWSDVAAIEDIDSVTVFYQPPIVEPDVFTVLHEFAEEGHFIGVVTATPPDSERQHIAVFPFEVGYTGFGNWPAIVGILLALLALYLLNNRRSRKEIT